MGLGTEDRNRIAKRAAAEISDGMLVNLGIGIPSLVPNHLFNDHKVMFHAENGLVGIGSTPETGKEDAHLCNAGGLPITIRAGASYCDSTVAFGMIRRGRVDITILGALQVSQAGDLANWIVPGKRVPGMGGAMELAAKAKKVIVLMEHNDKTGMSKLVKKCTLPLTAKKCVHMIITELGVFSVTSEGLLLTDVFDTSSIQEIRHRTEASFTVSENIHILKE
ncbi:3-oxoacid CoA-transferase subunit B [Peribacillus simplex]|uniref:Acyl CoA:acetate/3-ketoacid CoA transferase subunit beta n=1 Tax=Peribacillus simplex NBRC 15720 = DSM 1321 TaxID=1349754 RepID=A0A223ER15_9BACI|nr:3-oxoacid CoA-transferase subunit B [Peribacillus simplex]ASS97562.1 acyl CoA:acetate/3-ketoacid CoA transferase subunit beta [Peribacillus simplex NBRC 15720 = DSM 1321]MEC1395952.1 3-oxoacid CoA-transferase subunit B [Peribacillus simplex]MED3912595.1 3-oxoacid CoA-transferase subunit B [Peribacillus simplex]MED3987581.1 3-oxoacid CoA-transferase subunit B [Peribacillus simplex]MED4094208.1 3-oxoacid CoA-transferase subunit B [Peribacillus simplex]